MYVSACVLSSFLFFFFFSLSFSFFFYLVHMSWWRCQMMIWRLNHLNRNIKLHNINWSLKIKFNWMVSYVYIHQLRWSYFPGFIGFHFWDTNLDKVILIELIYRKHILGLHISSLGLVLKYMFLKLHHGFFLRAL